MHILLVESEPTVINLVKSCISAQHQITFFNSLQEAQKTDLSRFGLCIVRNELPDGKGIDLSNQIKENPDLSGLSVLLLSSEMNNDDFVKHQRSKLGADAYIRVPFSESHLADVLGTLMGDENQDEVSSGENAGATLIFDLSDLQNLNSIQGESEEKGQVTQVVDAAAEETTAEQPPLEQAEKKPHAEEEYEVEFKSVDEPTVSLSDGEGDNTEIEFTLVQEGASTPDETSQTFEEINLESESAVSRIEEEGPEDADLILGAGITPLPDLYEEAEPPLTSESNPVNQEISLQSESTPKIFSTPPSREGIEEIRTLRNYLRLKEDEALKLSTELRYSKEEMIRLKKESQELYEENRRLKHLKEKYESEGDSYRREIQAIQNRDESEFDRLRFEVSVRESKIRAFEQRIKSFEEKYEELRNRVKIDLRKIRHREQELESKLELLREDSDSLISSRDQQILDLKRKIDSLQFDVETLTEENIKVRNEKNGTEEKMARVERTVRMALKVLDTDLGPVASILNTVQSEMLTPSFDDDDDIGVSSKDIKGA